ncbi:MAG: DUF4070 domain-containing protein, partial [Parvibaculaceae bacterium]
TPLWDRIKAEGRLVEAGYIGEGNLTDTNNAPLLMSPEALRSGLRWLLNEVFSPENWFRRLEQFAELAPANINRRGLQVFSLVEARLAGALARRGDAEKLLLSRLEKLVLRRPDLISQIGYALIVYCQTRHVLDHFGLWEGRRDLHRSAAVEPVSSVA